MLKNLIITIDGPVASGKSSLAKFLSKKFGFSLLQTGLIYRAMAEKILEKNIDPENENEVFNYINNSKIDFKPRKSLYNDEIAQTASKISKFNKIRELSNILQKEFCSNHQPIVVEGRDSGTIVFPEAKIKLYITAEAEVRAKRRFKELKELENNVIYDDVLRDLKERDLRDSAREIAPLKIAENAFIIDSSGLNKEMLFDKALKYINSKLNE